MIREGGCHKILILMLEISSLITSSIGLSPDLLQFVPQLLIHDVVGGGVDEDDHTVDLVAVSGELLVAWTARLETIAGQLKLKHQKSTNFHIINRPRLGSQHDRP